MDLDPALRPAVEDAIAKSFRENFLESSLVLDAIGKPDLLCRAAIRAVYGFAFDQLQHRDAVLMLATILGELNAKHCPRAAGTLSDVKRDWDVIRAVLVATENSPEGKEVSSGDLGGDAALVAYNMRLLIDAGLAEGGYRDAWNAPPYSHVNRLTWEGHELLERLRSETTWGRIKALAKDKGVELTFESIKVLAKIALEQLLRG